MKKSKLLLTLLMVALFVGFTSCDDDDDINMKVDLNEVNVEVGEKAVVKITEGNGGYTVVSADEETATATLKDSEILISGIKTGTTTVTITDKEGKSAAITVNVVSVVGTWDVQKDKSTIEVEAKEGVADEIKVKLANDDFKSIYLGTDSKFTLESGEGEDATTIEGTYAYVDKILTLAFGEGEEAATRAFMVTGITKESTLKLKEDKTELYKVEYPEGEVVKVIVNFELKFKKD